MLSLILLFIATISVIMAASFREIRQRNAEMLARYAQLYDLRREQGVPELPPMPDGKNDPGPGPAEAPWDARPDYQLSTFYSVALAEDGSVLAVDNGEKALYEEEELIRIARQLLAEGRSSGRTGSLSYIISSRPDCTLVAFMDDTVTETRMNMLLRNVLIIGGAAIVVLFLCADADISILCWHT